jgi:hypothetical protein
MMDALEIVIFSVFGGIFCWAVFQSAQAWVREYLDREFDRGFRAGCNPKAGGWVYVLPEDVSERDSLPPEPKNAPGRFVAVLD